MELDYLTFKYNLTLHLIMKYFLHISKTKYGNYYAYRHNYRENGKVKTKDVHLGLEERAVKIISDFNSKKPLNERLLSFSGEVLLLKMLELVDFRGIINKFVQNRAKFDVGRFIEILVVERSIYEYSKWALANRAHEKSILSLDSIITREKFYENNIYHYMDYIYPTLDQIQREIVENLINMKEIEFNELIIDATSIHCFKSDDIEEPKNQIEKYKEVNRTHGYSRSKRPDLPQINLILGVSNHYIPFLFDAFSGNAPDPTMFKLILEKCKREYEPLLNKVKEKYLVFDKGNNSKDNIRELDTLCKVWKCYFVASVRPSLSGVKKQLEQLIVEELPVIYEQKRTHLRGKTITVNLYEIKRNLLLYVNEEIARKEQEALLNVLNEIQENVVKINQRKDTIKNKISAVEDLLRKKRLFSFFKIEGENGTIKCRPIEKKVNAKLNSLGKFAIMTNDFSLDAVSIIRIYKTTRVVEHEFHILKSVLSLYPLKHRKKERIKIHCALIIWGAMAYALLRALLLAHKMEFTFEGLKEKIKEGYVSIGDYIYPGYKSFRIQRTLNLSPSLQTIFKLFKLDFDYFEITLHPTTERKNNE